MTSVDHSSRAVLITGGASGLGEATALYFSSQGHPVVVLDLDEQKCVEIRARLGERGAVVCGSVLEDRDIEEAIDAAQGFGELRWVVACAGGGEAGRLRGPDPDGELRCGRWGPGAHQRWGVTQV